MGYFITIEGGDGSGKTSVMKEVVNLLIQDGYTNIKASREPGGVRISNQIREIILDDSNGNMDKITETLLFAVSRRQHLVENIIPFLESGGIFVCDRFIDSSYVYQGIAGEVGLYKVMEVNKLVIGEYEPNLTIFFDVKPEVALARINKDREINRIDLKGIHYHNKVYEGYKILAKLYPNRIVSVDASKSYDEVVKEVYSIIKKKLEEFYDERVSN